MEDTERGVNKIGLIVADGLKGLDNGCWRSVPECSVATLYGTLEEDLDG